MKPTRTLPRTAGVLACEFWRRLAASPNRRGEDAPAPGARPSGRFSVQPPASARITTTSPDRLPLLNPPRTQQGVRPIPASFTLKRPEGRAPFGVG